MIRRSPLVLLTVLLIACPALAVHPGVWSQTTEADFQGGKTHQTVVTNLGDIKLSVGGKELGEVPEDVSVIYDMTPVGDDVYIAAGPQGKLLKLTGDKFEEVKSYEAGQVFCVRQDKAGRLLVAVSGEPSHIDVLTDEGVKQLVELPGVRYIWDIIVKGDVLYVATGTEGKLLSVDLTKADDPQVTELYDTAQANLLCLGMDDAGRLYAGTDTDGLVYRFTLRPDAGENDAKADAFVLYDASEPEIAALFVKGDGTVYAGTSDADQAKPGRLEEAKTEQEGRPSEGGAEVGKEQPEVPQEPGDVPNVPPKPQPKDPDAPDAQKDQVNQGQTDQDQTGPTNTLKDTEHPQPEVESSMTTGTTGSMSLAEPIALDDEPSTDKPAVTPEMRDRLREVIRQRLLEARKSGAMQGPAPTPGRRGRMGRGQSINLAGGRPGAGNQASKEGNAVYRITPSGFVSEVFRESVMILRILPDPNNPDNLLVATGNEGQLFRVNTAKEETTILADLDPEQVPVITVKQVDGKPVVLLGAANPAQVYELEPGFADEGEFTSSVHDATQVSLWGVFHVVADVPEGTSVEVATRTGNVEDPEKGPWSDWSQPAVIDHAADYTPAAPIELTLDSPPARFLQYRLTLKGNASTTPVVDSIATAYVVPNLKPTVSAIKVNNPFAPDAANPNAPAPRPMPNAAAGAAGGDDQPRPTNRTIEWEAADPNTDTLTYTLAYRAAGSNVWLPIKDQIAENTFEWQTLRVPDGRYCVRVTASDSPDNPADMARTTSRDSDPVLIDNTPPAFEGLVTAMAKEGGTLRGRTTDALSPISRIQYMVDGKDPWKAVLPDDLIFDSTSEAFSVTLPDLSRGRHVVTLRAFDAQQNTVYRSIEIETP
ncbi:MAG: hypothetical protein GC164_00830 [Phycisphaera sp.]|nr:hypothetical protein [Phycisphaera sp.]